MLTRLGFETAALDAKLLAGHALGLSPVQMATHEHSPVSDSDAGQIAALLQRRLTGESVARIIGQREFYGLGFALNGATLEPRPETELLVDMAITWLPAGGTLLDLGTGTGCIAIAVLANRPDATAMATDISPQALEAAHANAERHGVAARLGLRQGSWFEPLRAGARSGEGFDLIVSNPPYIASAVLETLASEVRDFDPQLALDGGPDGLAPYRVIAEQGASMLAPSGSVLVEIGFDQGEAVSALFAAAGFARISIHQDLGGLDRVIWAHHVPPGERTAG
ncbi:MAG: prmC [Devosia sp.]|nr:prmC [Devosia sp.]